MNTFVSKEQAPSRRPFLVAGLILALTVALLIGRLWYLQLFKGEYFQSLSENNRIRLQDIPPARGLIYDRDGRLLVDNQPAFDLAVVREDVADAAELKARLRALLDLDPAEVQTRLDKARGAPPFVPIPIKSDLAWEEVARVETYKYETPGLTLLIEPRRFYLHPSLAAHLIGYTGEVTSRQLSLPRYKKARMGDRVGQYGIELKWQDVLAGQRGGRQVEVDATGRPLKILKEVKAKPGRNLYLSIDARLQTAAEEAMGDKAGAVVVLDVRNGQVLAMVSRPTFDQLDFVRGLSPEKWRALVNDPLHPLDNRAISGQYPPGSTFKVVTAIAGLMEGVITPETTFFCPGFYRFGNRSYGCWKKGGHGEISLHQAIVQSCDVYFYRVGQKLGVDRIAKWARALGLGRNTGIGLVNEKPGLIPTAAWKKKRFGVPWQDGETLSVAIGQGFDLVTPIQLARMTAAVANGGRLFTPQVVMKVVDGEGRVEPVPSPEPKSIQVPDEVLALIRRAMAGVVAEERGTGRKARVKGVTVAGKTGTAQVVTLEKFKGVKNIEDIPYKYRDHAWFIAFAPVEKPRIAVAVVAEHSGHGGSAAAPVAQKVISAYFNYYPVEPGQTKTAASPAGQAQGDDG